MKSAGKARNNGLYRHIRTSKEIIRNLLNDLAKKRNQYIPSTIINMLCNLFNVCRNYAVEQILRPE